MFPKNVSFIARNMLAYLIFGEKNVSFNTRGGVYVIFARAKKKKCNFRLLIVFALKDSWNSVLWKK